MTSQVSDCWIPGTLKSLSSFLYSSSHSTGPTSLGISILALPSTRSALPLQESLYTKKLYHETESHKELS